MSETRARALLGEAIGDICSAVHFVCRQPHGVVPRAQLVALLLERAEVRLDMAIQALEGGRQ